MWGHVQAHPEFLAQTWVMGGGGAAEARQARAEDVAADHLSVPQEGSVF